MFNRKALSCKKIVASSKFRGRVYSKAKQSDATFCAWHSLIEYQLQFKDIINDLVRNQLNNHRKNIFRAVLQLRKELLLAIQAQCYPQIYDRLSKLTQLLPSQSSKSNLKSFTYFLRVRQQLQAKKKLTWSNHDIVEGQALIERLKQQVDEVLGQVDQVRLKLLSLLSLYIVRIKGILAVPEEIKIMERTIEAKKKIIALEKKQDKNYALQCLLYLLFQHYKILFFQHHEQHILLFRYNEVIAYVQLYTRTFANHQFLESKFQIGESMDKMKPLLLNISIYQDTLPRNQIALQNVQREVQAQEGQFTYVKENKGYEQRKKTLSLSGGGFKSKLLRIPSLVEEKKRNIELVQIKHQSFAFQFVLYMEMQLFVGRFNLTFHHLHSTFDFEVSIQSIRTYILFVRIRNIANKLQQVTVEQFCRLLWKTFMHIFQSNDLMINELGNIQYANEHVPQTIDKEDQIIILMRIHDALVKLALHKGLNNQTNGIKLNIPTIKTHSLYEYIKEVYNDSEKSKSSQYQKRKAQLQVKNCVQLVKNSMKVNNCAKLVFFIKIQQEYIALKIVFQKYLRLIQINQMENIKETKMKILKLQIQQLKQIERNSTKKQFIVNIINIVTRLKLPQEKVKFMFQNHNIEEELHIDNVQELMLKYNKCSQLIYKKDKRQKHKINKINQQMVILKLSKKLFFILKKKQYKFYNEYSNEKIKIFLPKSNILYFPNAYRQIRMYYRPFHLTQKNVAYQYCLNKNKDGVFFRTQQLMLVLVQSQVRRINKQYCILQLYTTPTNLFVYKLMMFGGKQYFAVRQTRYNLKTVNLRGKQITLEETPMKYCERKKDTLKNNLIRNLDNYYDQESIRFKSHGSYLI